MDAPMHASSTLLVQKPSINLLRSPKHSYLHHDKLSLLAWKTAQGVLGVLIAAAAAKSLQSYPTLCDPIRRQPTRLPRPWDSPGKNTGVGCHFLLQCMKVKSEREVTISCLTLRDPMGCSLSDSSIHGIFTRQEYWNGVPSPSPWVPIREY